MLDKFEPWTTQAEALRTRHTIPVSPKTYDFLDQLADTYQARTHKPRFPCGAARHAYRRFSGG